MLIRTNATEEAKHTVRQKINSHLMTNRHASNMSPAEIEAMKRLKMDKDIIVLPADKGRATVVMNRVDYNEKAQALLHDQQSYKSAPASQAKSMIGQLTGLLSRLRRNYVISLDEWRQTKPTDTALARFHGLPKIHKPNVPLRPIVALKGSPTYNLANWMSRELNFLREGSVASVNSASQFLADIRGKIIQSDQIMVSFDVISLFTSILPDLARDVLRKRLEEKYDETTGPLKFQHLMQLFASCQRDFFTFDGRTYEQIKGTPMGSPISNLVAELVLQEVEEVAFSHYKPTFWRRYGDDTFVIIEKEKLSDLGDILLPIVSRTRQRGSVLVSIQRGTVPPIRHRKAALDSSSSTISYSGASGISTRSGAPLAVERASPRHLPRVGAGYLPPPLGGATRWYCVDLALASWVLRDDRSPVGFVTSSDCFFRVWSDDCCCVVPPFWPDRIRWRRGSRPLFRRTPFGKARAPVFYMSKFQESCEGNTLRSSSSRMLVSGKGRRSESRAFTGRPNWMAFLKVLAPKP
ncbi:hypothetical protein SprV_0602163000 [Sparganum proliferum]